LGWLRNFIKVLIKWQRDEINSLKLTGQIILKTFWSLLAKSFWKYGPIPNVNIYPILSYCRLYFWAIMLSGNNFGNKSVRLPAVLIEMWNIILHKTHIISDFTTSSFTRNAFNFETSTLKGEHALNYYQSDCLNRKYYSYTRVVHNRFNFRISTFHGFLVREGDSHEKNDNLKSTTTNTEKPQISLKFSLVRFGTQTEVS
jgi:hypothetical protein